MNGILKYAKAHTALIGSAVTACLAIFPPHTTGYQILSGVVAALTALGVYAVPNRNHTAKQTGYALIELLIGLIVVIILIWLLVALLPHHH